MGIFCVFIVMSEELSTTIMRKVVMLRTFMFLVFSVRYGTPQQREGAQDFFCTFQYALVDT